MCIRNINDGVVIEVLGEQFGIEGSIYQDDFQIWSVGQYVFQIYYQEVIVDRKYQFVKM